MTTGYALQSVIPSVGDPSRDLHTLNNGWNLLPMSRSYRIWIPLLLVAVLAGQAFAQRRGRGRFEQDPVALNNGWQFDYQKAKEQAAKLNKPMMVVFRCVP